MAKFTWLVGPGAGIPRKPGPLFNHCGALPVKGWGCTHRGKIPSGFDIQGSLGNVYLLYNLSFPIYKA